MVRPRSYDWGRFWGPITISEVLAAGVVLFVGFLLWERWAAEPLLPLALFGNRTYSVMLWVQGVTAFGMLGIYLPLVLVFQSMLGMSALRAGFTLAPWSVATMVAAPLAGRLADRWGGKYVPMLGLGLFSLGVGLMIPAVTPTATSTSFLLPGLIAGAGLGLALAPLIAEAMRDVEPQHAGAASGMLNAARQVGAVLGTTVVGAVLQGRLASALSDQAARTAPTIPVPPALRSGFATAFSHAGTGGGLQVAPGQNGGAVLPPGGSPPVNLALQQAAHQVFVHAFQTAARPALAAPVVAGLIGAACCLLLRRTPGPEAGQPQTTEAPAAVPAPSAASDPAADPASAPGAA